MGRGSIGGVPSYLRDLLGSEEGRSDRELLHAFAVTHDEAAFAAVMGRHGRLVWGVCRRLLRDEQDAEDAFQATFLVLARKAGSVGWREDAANWLYGVALRVARKVRARGQRRLLLEREAVAGPGEPARPPDVETAALVAEEVGRLPEKYRRPVVLCCLEGKSYNEAAELLGWPAGTVSGRLARAREMLRQRLGRRGLGPAEEAPALIAPPAALAQATLQAASRFAAGEKLTAASAALAEEVFRAMLLTKLKSGAALLLALVILGAGVVLLARAAPTSPAAPRADKPADRPPAAWAGRWVANPFAGAVTIEVKHMRPGGGPQVYLIKDRAAVEEVVRSARITGIRNGVYSGCLPTAQLTVLGKKGSLFEAGFGSDGCLSARTGMLDLDEGFFRALGRAAAGPGKPAINFREFLPGPPAVVKPAPRLTGKSLASGFESLEVTYLVGGRLHSTRIGDEKSLAAVHKSLTILGTARLSDERAQSRHMNGICKDGAFFYLHIKDRNTIFDLQAGRFTVAPAFFDALNREVSRRAGFPIDVTSDRNPLPEQSVRRARKFRELLDSVVSLSCTLKRGPKDETIVVEGEEAKEMLKGLRWVEGLTSDLKLPRWDRSVKLKTKDGRTVTLTYLNPGKDSRAALAASAAPGLADLVEVPGVGQVWIDNQWWGRFHQLAFTREQEAKQRRDVETSRLVCADWPTFLKVVLSVSVEYGEGDSELSAALSPEQTKAVVALLRSGRYERLSWSEKRWLKELKGLGDRKSGGLGLAPGLGFSLPLIIVGEKEMLVPMCGRLRFADSPVGKLQRIIAPDNPDKVKLLPAGKPRESR